MFDLVLNRHRFTKQGAGCPGVLHRSCGAGVQYASNLSEYTVAELLHAVCGRRSLNRVTQLVNGEGGVDYVSTNSLPGTLGLQPRELRWRTGLHGHLLLLHRTGKSSVRK